MTKRTKAKAGVTQTADGFQNFAARLGYGANNQFSASRYGFDFVTRLRTQLEAMYRTSWLVGAAVDYPAEDMTRAGIEFESVLTPEDSELMHAAVLDLQIWDRLRQTIQWSRLFGGAIGVLLIDGQDASKPLKLDSIGKDKFKGLLVLDRWLIQPSLTQLVTDLGPNMGLPKYYTVVGDAPALPHEKIHYSRIIRLEGIELPYYQRLAENMWGQSVVERLHDRLIAFDSTSQGAAQLVYKAHLRTYSIEQLREVIASGGKAMEALLKQIQMIRLYQSNEGMTLMDSKDKFEAHSYAFAGLSDLLLQFGQQLAGALQMPLVRLFGQSPAGLNSTGESDLRTYYDYINRQQEAKLRRPLNMILDVLSRSVLGRALPPGFKYRFNSLWQISDVDKSTIGQNTTQAVLNAYDSGLVPADVALRELRQTSRASGLWTNISDEDIKDAANAPPKVELTDGEEEKPV